MNNEHAGDLAAGARMPGDGDAAFGPVLLLGEGDPAFGPIILPGDTHPANRGDLPEPAAEESVVYPHAAFVQTLYGLLADIRRKEGLVVLSGESGTGKSLLLQHAVQNLMKDGVTVLNCDCRMSFAEFIAYCSEELGIAEAAADTDPAPDQFEILVEYLLAHRGLTRPLVVVVDDAQEMSEDLLAELILLSKWPTAGKDVLQLVLAGQPSLMPLLDGMVVRELVAADFPSYVLTPLKPEEIPGFVHQYYCAAHGETTPQFAPESMEMIAAYSHGVARLILTICHVAVVKAVLEGHSIITPDLIDEESRPLSATGRTQESRNDVDAETPTPIVREFPHLAVVPGSAGANAAARNHRREDLDRALRELRSECPGMTATALISAQGVMIASALSQDIDEARVAGMTAALLELGADAATQLRHGETREVIVRGEHGCAVVVPVGRSTVLLVLAAETTPLGLILLEIGTAVATIADLL